jgi:adenylate cyclase
MSDIFISYSRKDSEQALQLAERLQGEGMSVWIDQRGIEAAKTWSEEIVNAIEASKAFLLLLSNHSIESDNVARELSLAYESKRPLVPVAIEDVSLPAKFKYQLAGIQRVAYLQHEAISQALTSCGVSSKKPKRDDRKSLMILPFEDLSPTQDNGWFADGLVSEMIDKLSKIKSLRLVDRQTSLQIKKKGHTIAELAQILEVRYFVEGSIRKFDEQIKISSALLDFETGDYLWQDTHKGVFADIFQIQEAIADKVVDGLKLFLGGEEKKELAKKLTENAEAYERYLKGIEYYGKYTKEGFAHARSLYTEATQLDPEFTAAFAALANLLLELYRNYDRNPLHLEAAQEAIAKVRKIEGESARWCWVMSRHHLVKANYTDSEHYARRVIEIDSEFALGYKVLAYALQSQGRLEKALVALREYLKRIPPPSDYFDFLISLHELGDPEGLQRAALEALPTFEKRLKLCPEDTTAAVEYANVLYFADKLEKATAYAHELVHNTALDGHALYNLACLFVDLAELRVALQVLQQSVDRGFSNIEDFRHDPDLDPLRELPEFKALLRRLEDKIAAQNYV